MTVRVATAAVALLAGVGAALGIVAAGAPASAATWDELVAAGQQSRNWLNYGGDLGQMRYWPGKSITPDTVKNLKVKYIFQTSVVGSFQTTPIVENGIMYITTPYNHVFAVEAATGKELWHFQHKLATNYLCCGPNNRGVAILGDLVFMGTLDSHLIALNKKTGEKEWDVEVADSEMGYSETHAPVIYKDKVIIGISGAEYGIRGFISAYNAKDGSLAWRWHTIPAPDEAGPDGVKGWEGTYVEKADGQNPLNRDVAGEKAAVQSGKFTDAWRRGGGSNWMTSSVDVQRGLVFATTGNPSPDLDGSARPGDNRWSDSLVALDADTGKVKWAYQYLPHDVWDLDSTSPPVLADVRDDSGKMVPAVLHGGKTGWVYANDRETGKLIRRSEPMVPHENLFALPTPGQGTRMLPGANGGVEWSPCAFNPDTRLFYCVNLHQPMHYIVKNEPWEKGKLWLGGAFVAIPGEKQWGNVAAVSPDTGKMMWEARTEQPMIGGTMTTAGGVVFAGEANGAFNAYDAKSGQKVWTFQAGAGVNSAPMAFEVDGKPYVAVAAGGNFQINAKYGDALVVFGLD